MSRKLLVHKCKMKPLGHTVKKPWTIVMWCYKWILLGWEYAASCKSFCNPPQQQISDSSLSFLLFNNLEEKWGGIPQSHHVCGVQKGFFFVKAQLRVVHDGSPRPQKRALSMTHYHQKASMSKPPLHFFSCIINTAKNCIFYNSISGWEYSLFKGYSHFNGTSVFLVRAEISIVNILAKGLFELIFYNP